MASVCHVTAACRDMCVTVTCHTVATASLAPLGTRVLTAGHVLTGTLQVRKIRLLNARKTDNVYRCVFGSNSLAELNGSMVQVA